MSMGNRYTLENEIRRHHELGEINRTAEIAIRAYGDEIRGWLVGVTRDRTTAIEIYSATCEDIWRGLPGFRWDSSFRTWAYQVARNAWSRHLRSMERAREVEVQFDDDALCKLPQWDRSETHPWQRTEMRDSLARLRALLTPAERTLLSLRVEQRMAWDDIARIVASDGEPPSPEAIRRKATALRQQFQRLKAKLHAFAAQEGLLQLA
ncbi:RNA polymerase sigma factor [Polyangium aurulentum]|uniref:RNA polymerase sigma factor n=1 Tax=Polyangium aurulentum TaxID=2567896 RepID=UPI00146BF834|nr:sigma-70 family RNA polymerase sigma factor [Polyangium aurulentum]UQA56809.1 sigma-70 family RNA polymerase sigma factor [Polyangium aurulentum]